MATMKLFPLWSSMWLVLATGNAVAGCPANTDVQTIDFGPVEAAPDLPAGTILAQKSVIFPIDATDCGGLQLVFSGQEDGNNYITYSTGLRGIGYRIWHSRLPLTMTPTSGTMQITKTPEFLIQLIKTGSEMQTGTMPLISINMKAPYDGDRTIITLNAQAVIRTTTCSLLTKDIIVSMPSLDTSVFTGKGTTTGETNFSLDLQCYDGTRVDVTFTPRIPDTQLAVGVLTPTPQLNGATGLGVQILHQGVPVRLAESLVLQQQKGRFSLPFGARYYQMTDHVAAGPFQATALFSLAYQ